MLTQLTSRLASQLNDLTIQVVKDDWALPRIPPLSNSPVLGSYSPRLSSTPSVGIPSMFTSHPFSPHTHSHHPTHAQVVGGGSGPVKSHTHTNTCSSPHHHDDNIPSTSSVTPTLYVMSPHSLEMV